MEAIYYALTIVAIFVILFWYIQNERISPDDASVGLLATKKASKFEVAKGRKSGRKFTLPRPEYEPDDIEHGNG
jgi:hypothetical protein